MLLKACIKVNDFEQALEASHSSNCLTMAEKYRYQMISAPDEETLLADEDQEDGGRHLANGSAIMNGETRSSHRNDTLAPSIRRAKFSVENGNSHVYQRIAVKGGARPQFYLYYRAKRWYYRPAFIFTAFTFAVTFFALLFLKWGTIEPLSFAELDERIEIAADNNNPYLIRVERLPRDEQLRPTVANGQIGYAIGTNQLSIAGIYNGEKSSSRIAQIPMPLDIEISPPTNRSEWTVLKRFHTLDLLNGIYAETIALRNAHSNHLANITKSVYAHRAYSDLFVMELSLTSEVALDVVEVPLKYANNMQQLSSLDVEFQPTVESNTLYKFLSTCTARGRTRQAEFADSLQQDVILMWVCRQPDANQQSSIFLWTGSPEVILLAAGNNFTRVNNTFFTHQPIRGWLGTTHRAAWNALWTSANISIQYNTGNVQRRRQKRYEMGDAGEGPAPKPKSHVSESFRLAQTAYAAQYYLWSEIPLDFGGSGDDVWVAQTKDQLQRFSGVSRSGLAHATRPNCYSGHVFWDQEMWMMPTLTAMHPKMAQNMLLSRVRLLPAARQNAKNTQGGSGARYAWESARTGREVARDEKKAQYKLHVSCDISAALTNYARSGGNLSELAITVGSDRLTALDMAVDIASFWVSRLSCDKTSAAGTHNGVDSGHHRQRRHGDDEEEMGHMGMEGDSHTGMVKMSESGGGMAIDDGKRCHINNVIGPDEADDSPVDDSYYTNACAIQALLLPTLLCSRTSENVSFLPFKSFCTSSATDKLLKNFETYAAQIHMPLSKFNATWYYHPEHNGYDPLPASSSVSKQADVVLAAHPLGYYNNTNSTVDDGFNDELRRHDLYVYEAATASSTISTVSSAFSIGFAEITDLNLASQTRDRTLAAKYFRRQLDHVRGPFYTWSESSKKSKLRDDFGVVNYLPGIGGFLQSIVNGYAGLRYTNQNHMLLKLGLLPGAMEYAVNGIYYNNVQFNVRVTRKSSRTSGRQKRHEATEHEEAKADAHKGMPATNMHSSSRSGSGHEDEPNIPVVVEVTWHKPQSYESLMQQWMRRPGVLPSTPMNSPKPPEPVVRTKRHSEDENNSSFSVHICHTAFSFQKSASMRDKRHGDDEDDDDLPAPPTTAGKSVTPSSVLNKKTSKTGQVCQELQQSNQIYTFEPDVDGKLAVYVKSRAT